MDKIEQALGKKRKEKERQKKKEIPISFIGLVVGAIIRYTGPKPEVRVLPVIPGPNTHYNHSVPPDVLWLQLMKPKSWPKSSATYLNNHTFVYTFKGEIDTSVTEIDQKVSTRVVMC